MLIDVTLSNPSVALQSEVGGQQRLGLSKDIRRRYPGLLQSIENKIMGY